MKKKPAALLDKPGQEYLYKISLKLQEGHHADFTYSDREMARRHYEQIDAQQVVGGRVVKNISWEEIPIENSHAS